MVSAHRDFVDRINELVFVAECYESLLGRTDRAGVLEAAAEAIGARVPGARLTVFLMEGATEGATYAIHCLDDLAPIQQQADSLEAFFTGDVVRRISRANWICSMEDMQQMGLAVPEEVAGRVSAAAVPLGRYSPGLGFILVTRAAEVPLRAAELRALAHVCPGLSRALAGCRAQAVPTPPGV